MEYKYGILEKVEEIKREGSFPYWKITVNGNLYNFWNDKAKDFKIPSSVKLSGAKSTDGKYWNVRDIEAIENVLEEEGKKEEVKSKEYHLTEEAIRSNALSSAIHHCVTHKANLHSITMEFEGYIRKGTKFDF